MNLLDLIEEAKATEVTEEDIESLGRRLLEFDTSHKPKPIDLDIIYVLSEA